MILDWLADLVRVFLAMFLIAYIGVFFGFLTMVCYVACLEAWEGFQRKAARRRAHRLLALFLLATVAGCSILPPKVVSLPSACPAPRTPPPQRQLPESLPALVIGPTDDPAQAILQNRIASQQAYAECLQAVNELSQFIEGR